MARIQVPAVWHSAAVSESRFSARRIFLERRNYGPGVHGPSRVADHLLTSRSDREQKFRYTMVMGKAVSRCLFERLAPSRVTGEQMLQIWRRPRHVVFHPRFCEHRLPPRAQDGATATSRSKGSRKVNIPSFCVESERRDRKFKNHNVCAAWRRRNLEVATSRGLCLSGLLVVALSKEEFQGYGVHSRCPTRDEIQPNRQ